MNLTKADNNIKTWLRDVKAMSTFEKRYELTDKIEKRIPKLFNRDVVSEFGCQTIIGDNAMLWEYVKSPEVNSSSSGMIVKFAPDFILQKKTKPVELFFLDTKYSISPVWASARFKMLNEKSKEKNHKPVRLCDIGVIAREALLAYKRYYPNTIIIMASPYNPKLLMAQFAEKISCIFCYSSSSERGFPCRECPHVKGDFFPYERIGSSSGSQTPITNVDLSSFEPIEKFFSKIGVEIDRSVLKDMRRDIMDTEIDFSTLSYGKTEQVKNGVKAALNRDGCSWISYKVYTQAGNDFYHYDPACRYLSQEKTVAEHVVSIETPALPPKVECRVCGADYKEK